MLPRQTMEKHTEYLCKPNPKEKRLCICDPELFQMMGEIVYGERSVAAVEKKGVLTPSTLFFSKGLNFNWTPRGNGMPCDGSGLMMACRR